MKTNSIEKNNNNYENTIAACLSNIFNDIKSIELDNGIKAITEEELVFMNSNSEGIKQETAKSLVSWLKYENIEEQEKIKKFLNDVDKIQKLRKATMDSMLKHLRESFQWSEERKLFVAHQKSMLYGAIRMMYNNFKNDY